MAVAGPPTEEAITRPVMAAHMSAERDRPTEAAHIRTRTPETNTARTSSVTSHPGINLRCRDVQACLLYRPRASRSWAHYPARAVAVLSPHPVEHASLIILVRLSTDISLAPFVASTHRVAYLSAYWLTAFWLRQRSRCRQRGDPPCAEPSGQPKSLSPSCRASQHL